MSDAILDQYGFVPVSAKTSGKSCSVADLLEASGRNCGVRVCFSTLDGSREVDLVRERYFCRALSDFNTLLGQFGSTMSSRSSVSTSCASM